MWGLALTWILKNWKLVALLAAILALASYIQIKRIEVKHYQNEVVRLEAKIADAEHRTAVAEQLASQRATELTAKYQDVVKQNNELVDQVNKAVKEKISANEELKRVRLSLSLVQLWNESKQAGTPVAPTEQGNAGKARGTKAAPAPEVTLQDLFVVSAENDANHLKCVKQVEAWQSFWQDAQKAVEEVNAQLSRPAN